jgi:hypothetical protein
MLLVVRMLASTRAGVGSDSTLRMPNPVQNRETVPLCPSLRSTMCDIGPRSGSWKVNWSVLPVSNNSVRRAPSFFNLSTPDVLPFVPHISIEMFAVVPALVGLKEKRISRGTGYPLPHKVRNKLKAAKHMRGMLVGGSHSATAVRAFPSRKMRTSASKRGRCLHAFRRRL